MYFAILLLIVVPAGIVWLLPSTRVGTAISLIGASMAWTWIASSAYHSSIPINEPEWWGGLAISLTLAGIGAAIGAAARARLGQTDKPVTPRA